jgi:UDP-N-acetyl-D-mannosaminuronate dehydrogenase
MVPLAQIHGRSAQIGISGLGYAGLPLVFEFCRAGFRTTRFDIHPSKMDKLAGGESYIKHLPSPLVVEAAKLLENIYSGVYIALVNELKMVLERMDIDIWEVIGSQDQTFCISGLLSRPRPGRTLYPHRPVLSYLESQGI